MTERRVSSGNAKGRMSRKGLTKEQRFLGAMGRRLGYSWLPLSNLVQGGEGGREAGIPKAKCIDFLRGCFPL